MQVQILCIRSSGARYHKWIYLYCFGGKTSPLSILFFIFTSFLATFSRVGKFLRNLMFGVGERWILYRQCRLTFSVPPSTWQSPLGKRRRTLWECYESKEDKCHPSLLNTLEPHWPCSTCSCSLSTLGSASKVQLAWQHYRGADMRTHKYTRNRV